MCVGGGGGWGGRMKDKANEKRRTKVHIVKKSLTQNLSK